MTGAPTRRTPASYEAKDTKIYKGLDGVRRKIAMYLGGTDSRAVNHMVVEVVGNSNDEAQNGHGKLVQIHFARNGYITVKDDGRGIPVGPHPDYPAEDTMHLLLTEMHSGGKFHNEGETNDSYETSLGTHGVGVSVVNAASSSLEVWSWRNRRWNYLRFAAGRAVGGKTKPVPMLELPADLGIGYPHPVGTVIRYKPDLSVFGASAKINPNLALEWLDSVSWLVGDVRYEISVEGRGRKTIHRPNGLHDRFNLELQKLGVEPLGEPFIYHDKNIDVMLGWSAHTDEVVYSAVSAAATSEGGTHVTGLNAAITAAFAPYAGKVELDNKYLRTGLIAVINVKIAEPSFNSQDKTKLVSAGVNGMIVERLAGKSGGRGALADWLAKNKTLAKQIVERAAEFTALHADFRASKKLAAEFKLESKGKILLPKGLKAALTDNDAERELYLVEGDSAGGSGNQARNAQYQEVWPISGKIKNIYKVTRVEAALLLPKVLNTLRAMGWNPDKPGQFRAGKVIVLADEDLDGYHITALILGLLQRVTPELIAAGRVFKVDAPLYIYRTDRGNLYAPNLPGLQAQLKGALDPQRVQRIKGWGELSPHLLRPIAFTKETRKLTQVDPVTTPAEIQQVIDMLGEEVGARRTLLGLA